MGLWGSIRAYDEPLLPQRSPWFELDELVLAYGGYGDFCRAKEVGEDGRLFSEGKHREFHGYMYALAQKKGFPDTGAYGGFGDIYLEITSDMLWILWHYLLRDFKMEMDLGNEGNPRYGSEPWEFNHHVQLLRENYGRMRQLVRYELPLCYKIKDALGKGQVVYYSSSI